MGLPKFTIARFNRYKLGHGDFEQSKLIGVFKSQELAIEYLEEILNTRKNEWKNHVGIVETYWTEIKPDWSDIEHQYRILEIEIPWVDDSCLDVKKAKV